MSIGDGLKLIVVGSTILWAMVLDYVGMRKQAEYQAGQTVLLSLLLNANVVRPTAYCLISGHWDSIW